jgi:hypothetical protein
VLPRAGTRLECSVLESPESRFRPAWWVRRLTFDHWVATECGFDGGNVKISVNGGAWQLVKAADFIYNPYNTTLATVAQGNTNPLAGQPGLLGQRRGFGQRHVGSLDRRPRTVRDCRDKVKLRIEAGQRRLRRQLWLVPGDVDGLHSASRKRGA